MKIVKIISEIENLRKSFAGTIGFIPTMGYLHEGHLSLVKLAQKENALVFVSIFVNPKQFSPNEDLQSYPRDTDRDIALLEQVNVDVLFLPTPTEMYPEGFETEVSLSNLPQRLEGAVRPGHFTGVATVLTKLFHIVQPTAAYFGRKDAQQVAVVKKMVKDLNFPIKIIVGETIREADGLAMSSINVFLSPAERKEASVLYQSLSLAEKMFKDGETDTEKIKTEMTKLIEAKSGMIDYISFANEQLDEVAEVKNGTLVSLAVRFGKTRLIDNIVIK